MRQLQSGKKISKADSAEANKVAEKTDTKQEAKTAIAKARIEQALGIRVGEEDVEATEELRGVCIDSVVEGRLASKQKIRSGDILIGIGGWGTTTAHDMEFILNQIEGGTVEFPVKYYFVRNGVTLWGKFKTVNVADDCCVT